MKKSVYQKMICLMSAFIIAVGCAMPAFARVIDAREILLDINNAPEGTTMIEILVPSSNASDLLCEKQDFTVKMKISRYKTTQGHYDLADKEEKDTVISKDSEIAKYTDEDGFVSISARTNYVRKIMLYLNTYDNDDRKTERKCLLYLRDSAENGKPSEDIGELESRFGKFKAAYINEKGDILGVTDEFEVVDADEQYAFKADGNKLTLVMNNYAETVKSTLLVNLGFPVIIFIAVLIAVFITALVLFIWASQRNKKSMNDMNDDL